MGSIISKIADEIRLHGSWEKAQDFNEDQARKWMHTERPASLQRKPIEVPAIRSEEKAEPAVHRKYFHNSGILENSAAYMDWERAKEIVAISHKYESWAELTRWQYLPADPVKGLEKYHAEAAELLSQHIAMVAVNKHAREFYTWVNHQVIGGRTAHKLWLDYLGENRLAYYEETNLNRSER